MTSNTDKFENYCKILVVMAFAFCFYGLFIIHTDLELGIICLIIGSMGAVAMFTSWQFIIIMRGILLLLERGK